MEVPGGFAITILEDGASGEPALEGGAWPTPVSRRRLYVLEGLHRRVAQKWILLDPGRADGAGPVASWEIAGGALQQRGEAVEIVDGAERAARYG